MSNVLKLALVGLALVACGGPQEQETGAPVASPGSEDSASDELLPQTEPFGTQDSELKGYRKCVAMKVIYNQCARVRNLLAEARNHCHQRLGNRGIVLVERYTQTCSWADYNGYGGVYFNCCIK